MNMKTDNKAAEEAYKLTSVVSLIKHKPRIDMWEKDHKPGSKPPMIQDPSGTYHWMNRADRRKAMKNNKRKAS